MDFGEVPDKQATRSAESVRKQQEQIHMDEASLSSTLQHIVGQLDVLTQVWNVFTGLIGLCLPLWGHPISFFTTSFGTRRTKVFIAQC